VNPSALVDLNSSQDCDSETNGTVVDDTLSSHAEGTMPSAMVAAVPTVPNLQKGHLALNNYESCARRPNGRALEPRPLLKEDANRRGWIEANGAEFQECEQT